MRITNLRETKEKLILVDLPYAFDDLEPVLDKDTVEHHYKVLSKGYVERFNNGDGDAEFNKAGALLHNVWWPQLKSPKINNLPSGISAEFIEKHFGSYEDFKIDFNTKAANLQGSGWCYLSDAGEIKTIPNHKWKNDIILLIDCWEHSYNPFEIRKDYLKKIWRLINWSVINDRLNASSS